MALSILITGGTGLVGTQLQSLFRDKGYNVAVLSRSRSKGKHSFFWNVELQEMDKEAIEFADVIIHLAGENVSRKRWTAAQKKKIIDSRVKSTKLLEEGIKKAKKKPNLFISASAVGYYGLEPTDKESVEVDSPGNDFLAKTVVEWEESVLKIEELGIKTIRLRLGVVIAKEGGFLSKIKNIVNWGLASPVGSGKQFVAWIEISDLCSMFDYLINNETSYSVYNAVAPENITNRELMKVMAKEMSRPFIMPAVPAFAVRLLYGEMGDIILYGKKVSSKRIEEEGFSFKYRHFDELMKSYFQK
jgi:uncharacterized protein (TIGR01777 family)